MAKSSAGTNFGTGQPAHETPRDRLAADELNRRRRRCLRYGDDHEPLLGQGTRRWHDSPPPLTATGLRLCHKACPDQTRKSSVRQQNVRIARHVGGGSYRLLCRCIQSIPPEFWAIWGALMTRPAVAAATITPDPADRRVHPDFPTGTGGTTLPPDDRHDRFHRSERYSRRRQQR